MYSTVDIMNITLQLQSHAGPIRARQRKVECDCPRPAAVEVTLSPGSWMDLPGVAIHVPSSHPISSYEMPS